ncbi:hypothetical protein niasHT_005028 [Heterodera trifolii]|uniref:Uncharacterized protein n=1 Tax=Heterodera trifolii TaxID=157864 RepID=A0ABD2M0D6_9BILA
MKWKFHEFWGQDIWPSNLPNLNPLDISSWSFMDQSLYKRLASNNALKEAFQRTWDEIAEKRGADIWHMHRKTYCDICGPTFADRHLRTDFCGPTFADRHLRTTIPD